MKREIIDTLDGSKTLYIKEINESYHSSHGALQEAEHVFIKNGLNCFNNSEINILEIGLGTGINAFVTFYENMKNSNKMKINYFAIEKYPVLWNEIEDLNYFSLYNDYFAKDFFEKLHQSDWDCKQTFTENFHFKKIENDFFNLDEISLPPIDLVYFDAFGARVQPELWESRLFQLIEKKMKKGALLTTYSSKGSARRHLQDLGFDVIKLQGPKGKREMMNAWKK